MDQVFPEFKPFFRDGTIGFEGKLKGPRSGRIYDVILKSSVQLYPEHEPSIYMSPHPESRHWMSPDQRLSAHWVWDPARHTFAGTLLIAAKYIKEFD